jgi:undecaprenyl-diphosphatase
LFVGVFKSSFDNINANMNSWVVSINTGAFTLVAEGISFVFDTTALVVISLIVAAVLIICNYRRGSVLLLGAMVGDAILVVIFKELFQSIRPQNMLIPEMGYSFPSGHVTGSVVFFGVLTYLAWKHWASKKVKVSTGGFYTAMVVLVSFDRIYLNVHWVSDVVGAVLLGSFVLAFAITIFRYFEASGKFSQLGALLVVHPKST